jgi:putative phosphoribosyl transferase
MGAIATGGVRVLNEEVTNQIQISDSAIDEVATREEQELKPANGCTAEIGRSPAYKAGR